MKSIFSIMLCLGISGIAWGQNEITVPSGQSLKIATDTVVISGPLKISSTLTLSGYRFMGIRKTTAGDLNTFVGANSGNLTMTSRWNTFLGENTGNANTTGGNNVFLGTFSGGINNIGLANTFVGYKAGNVNTAGKYNVIVGNTTGAFNSTGESNVFLGLDAGWSNQSGSFNVAIGRSSILYNVGGNNNTAIGHGSGFYNVGSGNVYIGRYAGFNETGDNKLYIANHNTNLPMVYGEFPSSATVGGKFVINGRVGIGVTTFPTSATDDTNTSIPTSTFQLFVNGGMLSRALTVSSTWADYVFGKGYNLRTITDVEAYIGKHGHLPGVPSARDISARGLDLGEVAKIQQEKIEELTLYLIEQKKQILAQQKTISDQTAQFEKLAAKIGKQ